MHACRVRAYVHSALSLASMRGACASCAHGWPSSTSRWIDRFPDPRELLCWLSTMNNMTAATGTMIVVATPLNKQIARLHCQLGVLLHMLHLERKKKLLHMLCTVMFVQESWISHIVGSHDTSDILLPVLFLIFCEPHGSTSNRRIINKGAAGTFVIRHACHACVRGTCCAGRAY